MVLYKAWMQNIYLFTFIYLRTYYIIYTYIYYNTYIHINKYIYYLQTIVLSVIDCNILKEFSLYSIKLIYRYKLIGNIKV